MISATLLTGVMSCGRCKVLTEIKLKRKKSFQRGAQAAYQSFSNFTVLCDWTCRTIVPVHLIFTQNLKQNTTFSLCGIFHIQNRKKWHLEALVDEELLGSKYTVDI